MTLYDEQTWQDDNPAYPPSAARFAHMEDGIRRAFLREYARVYRTAVQSIPSAAYTAILFTDTRADNDSIHDPAIQGTRLVCRTAGFYMIGGSIEFEAFSAAGIARIALRLNGTTLIDELRPPQYGTAVPIPLSICTGYPLGVGDFVELLARQDTGVARNVVVTPNASPEFWMARLG